MEGEQHPREGHQREQMCRGRKGKVRLRGGEVTGLAGVEGSHRGTGRADRLQRIQGPEVTMVRQPGALESTGQNESGVSERSRCTGES